jgi:DNA modification methylase
LTQQHQVRHSDSPGVRMIYHETEHGVLYNGESLEVLRTLPDNSVNCCVTSPPYWGLRDYGHDKQLGLEKTPEEYVSNMVLLFREVRRVLRQDGTLWLNLGDSYASNGCYLHTWMDKHPEKKHLHTKNSERYKDVPAFRGGEYSIKPKDLVGIPWRVAFALQADGWYLRQDIIWHKPNPMPESVTDRCTKAHEYVFLMSKSAKYYYDNDAIKEQANYDGRKDEVMKGSAKYANGYFPTDVNTQTIAVHGHERWKHKDDEGNRLRNKRSVWTVTTKPFKEAHFATFPRDLIRPMIQAGCPEQVCVKCGKARYPILKNTEKQHSIGYSSGDYWKTRDFKGDNTVRNKSVKVGYTDCGCNAGFQPGIVLDPFMGSGTTAIEAIYQDKRYIGIELNPKYCEIAARRIETELDQTDIFREEQ